MLNLDVILRVGWHYFHDPVEVLQIISARISQPFILTQKFTERKDEWCMRLLSRTKPYTWNVCRHDYGYVLKIRTFQEVYMKSATTFVLWIFVQSVVKETIKQFYDVFADKTLH